MRNEANELHRKVDDIEEKIKQSAVVHRTMPECAEFRKLLELCNAVASVNRKQEHPDEATIAPTIVDAVANMITSSAMAKCKRLIGDLDAR
jgi:hypothetical protein